MSGINGINGVGIGESNYDVNSVNIEIVNY